MINDNKKIIFRGLILLVILTVMFFGLNFIVRYGVENERFGIIKQIEHLPDNQIDVLIVGNSHAQEGLNHDMLSSLLNTKVYNFSFSQQESAAVYYFLKNTFKKQSPKVVVLEAYTIIQPVKGAYDLMHLSKDKIEFYDMLFNEASFYDVFIPLVRMHNFWSNPKPFSTIVKNLFPEDDPIKSLFSARIMSDIAIKKHNETDSLSISHNLKIKQFQNVLKIRKLCETNGAELIIVMLPWYKTLVDNVSYENKYYLPIKKFSAENDILYYDMNMDMEFDWEYKYFREQDYTQNTHLNAYGQLNTSIKLAQYLSSIFQDINYNDIEPALPLKDYLKDLDTSNDILFIDDCPNPINEDIKISVKTELKRLNMVLSNIKSADIEIILISDGTQYNNYDLIDTISFTKDAVNIYELNSTTSDIISHAVIRWDEFDMVFIR